VIIVITVHREPPERIADVAQRAALPFRTGRSSYRTATQAIAKEMNQDRCRGIAPGRPMTLDGLRQMNAGSDVRTSETEKVFSGS